jgi:RNA polymerase sigma factor (sigma-70 family)
VPTDSSASSDPPQPPSGAEARFLTTRWTQVTTARGGSPEARAALSDLCERYWAPVHRFIQRERGDDEEARELTQEFFARLLAGSGVAGASPELGRFRTYLLGAVKHFLTDQRDRQRAAKRGQGVEPLSLSAPDSESSPALQVADASTSPQDARFDREWALQLLERTYTTLASEWRSGGRTRDFELLKPWLVGDTESLSQAEVARQLGLREGAVKVAIHRLRKRFRQVLREEIAQTLSDPAQIPDELRYFAQVLASARQGPG